MLNNELKTSMLSLPGLLATFPGIKEQFSSVKKQASFGTEKLKDIGITGLASAFADISPMASSLLSGVLSARQSTQNQVSGLMSKAQKDPELMQKIKDKLPNSKNLNKDLFKTFRNLEKSKSTLGKEYKSSDTYQQFGDLFEMGSKSESGASNDSSITGSDSSIDILKSIEENTRGLSDAISNIKPNDNANDVVQRIVQSSPKGNGKVSKPIASAPRAPRDSIKQVSPLMSSLLQRSESVSTNKEQQSEESRVELSESNQTQTLLEQVRDSIKENTKVELESSSKESTNSSNSILDTVMSAIDIDLPGRKNSNKTNKSGKPSLFKNILSKASTLIPGMPTLVDAVTPDSSLSLPDVTPNKPMTTPDQSSAGKKGLGPLAKGGMKSVLKKIPLIGAVAGLGYAGSRLMDGDFAGAGLEALSGIASTIPGLGTVASLGLDAALAAKDSGMLEGISGSSIMDSVSNSVSSVVDARREAEKKSMSESKNIVINNVNNNTSSSGQQKSITPYVMPLVRNNDSSFEKIHMKEFWSKGV